MKSSNLKKYKRAVITGGQGFIGRNLIQKLLASDYFGEIVVIDKKDGDIKTVVGDFWDGALLGRVVKEGDTVIHLACTTIPATSEKDPQKDFEENILGTKKLLDICQEKKIAKFVFMSSGGTVYGEHGRKKLKEDDATDPVNFHGLMKLEIEKLVKLYSFRHGLDHLIIRGANPYGRTGAVEKPQGVIDVFIRKALAGEKIEIWGDGRIIRDFIHIDDLSGLIALALEKDLRNETINGGSGKGYSLNELVAIIERVVGKSISVERLNNRDFDVSSNVLDMEKVRRLLAWKPRVGLEEGIGRAMKKISEEKL